MELDLLALESHSAIIGCDEVGRGPIAGPVTAAAVKLSSGNLSKHILNELNDLKVTDSKKLSTKKRKTILEKLNIDIHSLKPGEVYEIELGQGQLQYCLFEHDHEEIDEMNILQASLSAMKISAEALHQNSDKEKIFVDGNKLLKASFEQEAIVKGDSKYTVIALASIIAKEFRDEKMGEFDKLYPGYNLKKNAGYPTQEHKHAITQIGISPIHRKSFKGVKEYL